MAENLPEREAEYSAEIPAGGLPLLFGVFAAEDDDDGDTVSVPSGLRSEIPGCEVGSSPLSSPSPASSTGGGGNEGLTGLAMWKTFI